MPKIAVLPGDGIGPEVCREAVKVLDVAAAKFGLSLEFQQATIGGAAIDEYGVAMRDEDFAMCEKCDAILLGAVGGPKWDDPEAKVRPEQALFKLRYGFKLYANLRPVKVNPALIKSSPIREEVLQGTDLVVVRELTGGLYFGKPSKVWKAPNGVMKGVDTMAYSQPEIERIAVTAFELARNRRKKVTSVDKANVLSTSRLWRQTVAGVAKKYPDVEVSNMLVDNCSMQLIRDPRQFDVVVTENMFGDILTDEASQLTGSMGLLPSASLGKGKFGLYEPIHGTAPDIAGKGIANPLAMILSSAMMLRLTFDQAKAAEAIEGAVQRVLEAGHRTADLGGKVPTTEMGDLVVKELEKAA
ncbi:MAG TPA: 3-isopropylmalate dehydrogenase [Chloroflexota bacterium]|nr:3-isopropylmalate dehydrogenase [Chloroflexota bacterium]